MTQLVYNSVTTETIRMSSFYTNYEFNSAMNNAWEIVTIAQKAKVQINHLKNLYEILQWDIKFTAEQSAVYYNKKRDRELTLKERNKVYLLHHNIKTKWLSNKLNYVKLRLFLIVKKKRSINYKLTLSSAMWIHSVFTYFYLNQHTQICLCKINH